eukprot:TRINITY_DN3026_c0_g1_i3.p1 TRINITY_DN3026_c0_g1~~TRINITY_DN3026_c0_g1_i3.p1  ORF type:complete len:385 (-),score=141.31 TRINITY_DN3026_c0_g1_i3:133-1287(-)
MKNNEEMAADYRKNLSDAISLLPKLQYGMDINVKFKGCQEIEYTPECVIFDLLGIDLVHGWTVDPTDRSSFAVLGNLSYNQMMEKLVASSVASDESNHKPVSTFVKTSPSSRSPRSPKKIPLDVEKEIKIEKLEIKEEKLEEKQEKLIEIEEKKEEKEDQQSKIIIEASVIDQFMAASPSQLTYNGLYQLHEHLQENSLSVFFRANHFATIIKYKGDLYVLITDAGFRNETVVWEKLDDVSGDGDFYMADFTEQPTSVLPPMLASAIAEVGSSVAAILPEDTSTLLKNEPNSASLISDDYVPSESELRQQLVIEQRIQQQKHMDAEQRDREFALQLHKEELAAQKQGQNQEQRQQKKQDNPKTNEKKDAANQSEKKKEKDCCIQ